MKSEIIEKDSELSGIDWYKRQLLISSEETNNVIILSDGICSSGDNCHKFSGTVVNSGQSTHWKVGKHSDHWDRKLYSLFTGQIKLFND